MHSPPDATGAATPSRRRRPPHARLAVAAAVAVLAPLRWMWQASLLPDRYSVLRMGEDAGHGGTAGRGALVLTPPGGVGPEALAVAHVHDGIRTVNGRTGGSRVDAAPGERCAWNTDNARMAVWVPGGPFRLLAVDGTDVHAPGEARDVAVEVTGGARADLEVVAPARVELGGAPLLVGAATAPAEPRPVAELDLLSYGAPAPLGFDPAAGDVVAMRVENRSGEGHPMHLHGHRVVVLARGGVAATGSPWWTDSLQVGDGGTDDIAFVAGNPGIWTDHCHDLPHAAEGPVTHLIYGGVTTPYTVGGPNGPGRGALAATAGRPV